MALNGYKPNIEPNKVKVCLQKTTIEGMGNKVVTRALSCISTHLQG